MSQGKTNKTKGSNGEREYAKLFRELGYPLCKTARQGSRLMDDAGIDLINIPFNVQIKVGKHTGMNASKVLAIIKERLPMALPPTDPIHKFPSVLIHKKQVGIGNKRGEFDTIVSMSLDDFIKIIKNDKSK